MKMVILLHCKLTNPYITLQFLPYLKPCFPSPCPVLSSSYPHPSPCFHLNPAGNGGDSPSMDVVLPTDEITTASAATLTSTDPTQLLPQPPTNTATSNTTATNTNTTTNTTRTTHKKEIKHVPTVWEKLIEKYDYDAANNHKLNEGKSFDVMCLSAPPINTSTNHPQPSHPINLPDQPAL